jgi:hypothetical protein
MSTSKSLSILKPLDKSKAEIRLLHLQPHQSVDTITCTLYLGDLDDPECEYEALSYEVSYTYIIVAEDNKSKDY